MSLHLIEMENLNEDPVRGTPRKPRPKPRAHRSPHTKATILPTGGQPRPKPRRRRERDVDSVSSSGGDHRYTRSPAYDNPLFQNDDGDAIPYSKTKESPPPPAVRRKKGTLPQDPHDIEDSSAWDGEESYLYIENELAASKRGVVPAGKRGSSRRSSTPLSEATHSSSPQVEGKKSPPHTAIQMEEGEAITPTPDPKTSLNKPKIGSIWQRFLSRGGSTTAEPPPPPTQPRDLHLPPKSEDKEKGVKVPSRKTRGTASTSVSESSSGEEDAMAQKKAPMKMKTRGEKEEDVDRITRLSTPVSQSEDENRGATESRTKPGRVAEKLLSLRDKGRKKLQGLRSEEREHDRDKQQGKDRRRKIEMLDEDGDKEQEDPPVQVIKSPKAMTKTKGRKKTLVKQMEAEEGESSEINGRTPPAPEPNSNLLFGVTIHGADLLPVDPNVLHPVVKVTLMSQEGHLIRRRDPFWPQGFKSPRKRKKGRPPTTTILPIMTQPFQFQLNYDAPSLTPSWNELLLFEEPFHEFLAENPDLIIFFELTDFLPMERASVANDGVHGTDVGWYKLAWAFLKPLGVNGSLNTDKRLRLQLFKPVKLKNREFHDGPEVFSWWKSGRREKLVNTTLYVTVKGVCPPLPTDTSSASLRQLLSMRKEELTDAVVESQLQSTKTKRKKKRMEEIDVRKVASWTRLEGQSCKVPNKFLASLPSSPIESLNLTITGNVHSLKFSPCGLKLAAGLDTDDLHAVLIFDIPSGNLLRSLKNHHGLIYDLCWREVEGEEDSSSYLQYLASASADATSCVWKMRNNNETTLSLVKTLHHPTFVYAVAFHPSHPSLVVTACFDFIIRVWDILEGLEGQHEKRKRGPIHISSPLFILDQHCSFVNCLAFDVTGSYLFSGDGDSSVFKWHVRNPTKKKSWTVEREVKLVETGKVPVNSLCVHPTGIRLLCHLRDNSLKILDTTNLLQLHTITGFVNDRLQIRSCFSPCGNLILSGSEDSTICIWDADTYAIADFITPRNHPHCFVTCVEYHPLDFYLGVGLASAISESNPILLYTYDSPKLSQIAMVQAGVAKFKSSLRKSNKKGVTFREGSRGQRGDSSEKFQSIIEKLDGALTEANGFRRRRMVERSTSADVGPNKSPSGLGLDPERPESAKTRTTSNADKAVSTSTLTSLSSKPRYKSKSPRTYIEERLEELILPPPPVPRTKSESDGAVVLAEETSEKNVKTKVNENEALSPKRLPKPRPQRPHSSRIPVPTAANHQSRNGEGGRLRPASAPNSPKNDKSKIFKL